MDDIGESLTSRKKNLFVLKDKWESPRLTALRALASTLTGAHDTLGGKSPFEKGNDLISQWPGNYRKMRMGLVQCLV